MLRHYLNRFSNTKTQQEALDWVQGKFSKETLNAFTSSWKGSSSPKLSSVFHVLTTTPPQAHQTNAFGILDAASQSLSQSIKTEFEQKWSSTVKYLMSRETLCKALGVPVTEKMTLEFNNALVRVQNAESKLVQAHFLGQILHETGMLRYKTEIASGNAYEGRRVLGNTEPGDGRRFKGAGAIQLTGRANYQAFSKFVNDDRVMEGANYVAEHYFWETAVFFWNRNKLSQWALKDDLMTITRRINGGTNGLADRKFRTNQVKKALGLTTHSW
jgi:predicted chitinase